MKGLQRVGRSPQSSGLVAGNAGNTSGLKTDLQGLNHLQPQQQLWMAGMSTWKSVQVCEWS